MKKYLITDPQYYTQDPSTFAENLRQALSRHQPDYALYRDKQNPNAALLAGIFVQVCKEFCFVKAMIHSDLELAQLYQADGVHLRYQQKEKIEQAKQKDLRVIVSTHTHQEILELENSQIDAVTYSPIFATPNKGEPKGVQDLQKIVQRSCVAIFALGGIVSQEQLHQLKESGAKGFASIRYFAAEEHRTKSIE